MGYFVNVCACGKAYTWTSFNRESVLRGQQCDACWLKEGVDWKSGNVKVRVDQEMHP